MDLNNAYKFSTFSDFLNQFNYSQGQGQQGLVTQFNPTCIYCLCPHSVSLMNDGGSFRRCSNCKREFRANMHSMGLNPHSELPSYKVQQQIRDYNYTNPYAREPKSQNELATFNPDAYVPLYQQTSYYNHDTQHFQK